MPPKSNVALSELVIKFKHGKRNVFISVQPKVTISDLKKNLARALNDTIENKTSTKDSKPSTTTTTTTTVQEIEEDGVDTIKTSTTTSSTSPDHTKDTPFPIHEDNLFLALPTDKNNPAAGFTPIIDPDSDDDSTGKKASKVADLGLSDYSVIAYKIGENDSFTIEIPTTTDEEEDDDNDDQEI